MKPTLSKSSYIEGRRCPLSLWYAWHRKDIIPPPDPSVDAKRAQGEEIGALARRALGNGAMVTDSHEDPSACIAATDKFVAAGADLIFEAAAANPADGAYSYIDALRKVPGTDEWDMIEVKSSTSVKDYHIEDLSFQYHAFTGAGYKIRNTYIMLIDNKYRMEGNVDPAKLFRLEDVTKKVRAAQKDIPANIAHINHILADDHPPSMDVSMECNHPNDCAYREAGHGIPLDSIFNVLSEGEAKKVARLTGSFDVADIPADKIPKGARAIDVAAHKSGQEHIDAGKIRGFLSKLEYPLYFLDYETVPAAIPLYEGTRPYQQVPFQFSLHVQEKPGGPLAHYEFLHRGREDPRRAFTEALLEACGDKGSVIIYSPFETARNKELAADFPEYATRLNALNARIVDLLEPFKNRWLYSPKQNGQASIKYVLPAFTDLSYTDMEIGNGAEALAAYAAHVKGTETPDKLWTDLLKYCKQDTYAMVVLMQVLRDRAGPARGSAPEPGPG